MKEPHVPPMTETETKRIETLEHIEHRSSPEDSELEGLYLHRWLYRNIQRGIVVFSRPLRPIVSALTGRSSWGKSKGTPLLIIPVVPSTKWSITSAVGSLWALISWEFTPSQLAALGMVAGLLTSLIASVTSIIIAIQGKTAAVNAQTAILENTALTQKTSQDVETVKKDVDGMKSKDSARIAELEREAMALKQQLADQKQERALLAQAAAPHTVVITGPTPSVPSVSGTPVDGDAIDTLKQIDKDTTAIEKNTAATETKVDALKDQK